MDRLWLVHRKLIWIVSFLSVVSCKSPSQGSGIQGTMQYSDPTDGAAKDVEIKTLMSRVTTKYENIRGLRDFPSNWPVSQITVSRGDESSHKKVEAIANAVFEHALAAYVQKNSKSTARAYASVARKILVDLSSKRFHIEGSNGILETAWFASKVARGTLILKKIAVEDGEIGISPKELANVTAWLNDASIASKVEDACTLNYVDDRKGCNGNGATNRTFALLEAQLRIAEVKSDTSKINLIIGRVEDYLPRYFTDCDDKLCRNRDFARKDGKHPAMGLASIMQIEALSRRNLGRSLTQLDLILKGLVGVAENDQRFKNDASKWSCYTGSPFESALTLFGFDQMNLGPVKESRDIARERSYGSGVNLCKYPYLAWGYDLISDLNQF